jgi:parvulin-like peptidyl-prolyl isomerase
MTDTINITPEELLNEVKLSLQFLTLSEQITTHKLIAQAAAEAGIQPDPEDVQKAANQIRLTHNLLGASETYAWLEKYGLSMDDLEQLARRECLKQQLVEHLFSDKIDSYFVQHQLDYLSAVLYEVIFEDEELAYEQYYALQAGETTFQQVAYQYIQDTERRRAGGYLGIRRRSELHPDFRAIVFAANPPQVLKPAVIESGVYLILVEEVIQPGLEQKLEEEIRQQLFNGWIMNKRDKNKTILRLNT